jgi:hypothetical protein
MLTPARLRTLAEVEATSAIVVSFYMQLNPDRRLGSAGRTFFSSLCDATLKPIEDRLQRKEIQGELDRIGHALEAELPALGRVWRSSRTKNWACGGRSPYRCPCLTVFG